MPNELREEDRWQNASHHRHEHQVTLDINLNIHGMPASTGGTDPRIAQVLTLLQQLINQGEEVMADLSSLTTAVEANTAVEQSAVTLINGLADQIRALATDPAALTALADQLTASSADLAAAVAANTPAAPEEPPA